MCPATIHFVEGCFGLSNKQEICTILWYNFEEKGTSACIKDTQINRHPL